MCVCVCVCVCVCACERGRELEREREGRRAAFCVCVCVHARMCERGRHGHITTTVCMQTHTSFITVSVMRLCSPLRLELMVKLRTLFTVFIFILKAKACDYGKRRYITPSGSRTRDASAGGGRSTKEAKGYSLKRQLLESLFLIYIYIYIYCEVLWRNWLARF